LHLKRHRSSKCSLFRCPCSLPLKQIRFKQVFLNSFFVFCTNCLPMFICPGSIKLSRTLPQFIYLYNLSVICYDGWGLVSPCPATVNINLLNTTESILTPVFTSTVYLWSILDSSTAGRTVGRVQATSGGGAGL